MWKKMMGSTAVRLRQPSIIHCLSRERARGGLFSPPHRLRGTAREGRWVAHHAHRHGYVFGLVQLVCFGPANANDLRAFAAWG